MLNVTQPETVAVELTIQEWRRYRRGVLGIDPQKMLARLAERGVEVSRQTLWRAETGGSVSERVCAEIDDILRGDDA